ncbi:neuropeptide FF receptor 2-like [Oculina patagonica]
MNLKLISVHSNVLSKSVDKTSSAMGSNTTNDSVSAKNIGTGITQVIQLSLYVTVIIVGSLGNLLVCLAIYLQKRRKPNEFFILNLALTDLGASIFSIPLDLTELLTGKFLLGPSMCHVVYPIQTMLMGTSVLTLLCLSVERHRAIVTPLKPRIQVKTAFVMISATWLVSMAAVAPYASILHLEGDQCREKWPREIFVKSFTMSVFLLLYFIPLLVITANYVSVMQKLSCELKRLQHLFSGRNHSLCKHVKKRAEQNIKVVKVFVTAVVVFAICLLPNHVLWLWHDFGQGKNFKYFNEVVVFCNIMVYINSAINPFIFGKIRIRNCCNGSNKEHGRHESSIISRLSSKAPKFYLRVREMSDIMSRPSFIKRVQQKWQVEEGEEVV